MWLALPSAVSAATITASLKPAFQADLTSTLKLQAGSGSPTFTRATTAYVQDFEGVLRPVLSGEARFQGARRVRNRLLNTTGAAFSAGTGSSPTITSNSSTAPDGTLTATRVQMALNGGSTTNDRSGILFTIPNEGAGTVISSVWLKANSGSPTIQFRSALGVAGITLTNTWQRYAVPGPITVSESLYIWLRGAQGTSDSADISVWHPQVETTTTGQSNQNPSEYVSIGTLSAPYHGANVDGVKYFSTMNGNTVSSSYVVTEATGPAINSSTAKFAQLPGTSGSYFSTPDSSVNSITGDIDIRAYVALDDWTPTAFQTLVAKDTASGRSYTFGVDSTSSGALYFQFTTDGVNVLTPATSSAVNTFANGTAHWVRMTHNPVTGKVNFYTSEDGATWTSLGVEQTVTVGTVADTSSPMSLGAFGTNGTLLPMSGKLYRTQVYNGIAGTLAVNFNPNTWASGSTWTAGTTGETWTISGGASVFAGTGLWDSAGPFGYFAEGTRTNLALQSNALTTTWLAVQSPSATQNVTGPDGVANSAWTLTDNSASLAEYVQQNITLTAATYTQSWYIKKTTGAQTSYPLMIANSNTKLAAATIDTTNGIATVWTAYTGFTVVTSSATCSSASASWWRCQLTFDSTAESWVHYAHPAGATSATQSSGVWDVSAQGSAVFYGGQVELGSFASSYIPTTTGSATRNADVLSYPTSRNISGSLGTAYAEPSASYTASAWPSVTVVQSIILGGNPGVIMYGHTSSLRFYDGTAERTLATFTPTTALSRVAVVWGGNARSVLNGTVGTAQSFDGDIGLGSNLYIGSFTGGLYPWFGTIRGVKVWPKALTTSQLTAMTTSSSATSRAAIPQTTVKAPTKTGLVGAWTFDEGTGTKANDSSGLGHTGTLAGGPTWATGKLGKALNFDGTNQYMSAGTATLNLGNNLSVGFWIKPASAGWGSGVTNRGIIGKGSPGSFWSATASTGFTIGINRSTNDILVSLNGLSSYYTPFSVSGDQWSFLYFTYDGSTLKAYKNGTLVQTYSSVGASALDDAGYPLILSEVALGGTGRNINGLLDDARIYNRALSATEINALYRSTATVINTSTNTVGGSLTSGLVGLWSFDGKDMNWGTSKAFDRSGAGNDLTISGMSTSSAPVIGKIGQALNFNGGSSYLTDSAIDLSGTNTISLSWWMHKNSYSNVSGVLAEASTNFNTSTTGYIVGPDDSSGYILVGLRGNVNYSYAHYTRPSVGVWHHYVALFDKSQLGVNEVNLYIDGVLQTAVARPASYNNTNNFGNDSFYMGMRAGSQSPVTAKIDDFRIYNRALSATEAKALYNLGR